MYDWILAYVPMLGVLTFFGYLLTLESNISKVYILPQILFLALSYYAGHKLCHYLPSNPIINLHVYNHHDKKINISRHLGLLISFIHEIFGYSIELIIIQYVLGIWFIPLSLLLFYYLTSAIIHLFIYSLLGSERHMEHHIDPTKNIGPDYMDHFFGTNSDSEYEDMNGYIPCAVMGALIVHFAKLYFQWKD
jgi:hypothetical protein